MGEAAGLSSRTISMTALDASDGSARR